LLSIWCGFLAKALQWEHTKNAHSLPKTVVIVLFWFALFLYGNVALAAGCQAQGTGDCSAIYCILLALIRLLPIDCKQLWTYLHTIKCVEQMGSVSLSRLSSYPFQCSTNRKWFAIELNVKLFYEQCLPICNGFFNRKYFSCLRKICYAHLDGFHSGRPSKPAPLFIYVLWCIFEFVVVFYLIFCAWPLGEPIDWMWWWWECLTTPCVCLYFQEKI